MPSSSTAISCSLLSRSRVMGTPISLFRLPSVLSTLYFSPRTAATMSLVVVLPTEPVRATTGMGNFFL